MIDNPIIDIEPISVSTDPLPEVVAPIKYYERGEGRALAEKAREEGLALPQSIPGNPCAALSRQSGLPCRNPAVAGKDVCVNHAGAIEGGFDGNRKPTTMGRSKYLRTDLAEKVEEARDDPELMGFKEDVLLFESRLRILEQSRKNGSFVYNLAFEEASQAFKLLKKAMLKDEGPIQTGIQMDRLEKLFKDGVSENAKDKEQERLAEKLGRTKEREYKRMAAIGAFMSVSDVKGIMLDIQTIILEEVKDETTLQRISQRFGKYAFQRFGNGVK